MAVSGGCVVALLSHARHDGWVVQLYDSQLASLLALLVLCFSVTWEIPRDEASVFS